jgi:type II secretory pathway pseudopilin PulG
MRTGSKLVLPGASSRSPGFALPLLLVAVAAGGIAATAASESSLYRQAREREDELHFRAGAYVAAIRSFYMAEPDPRLRRLPVSVEELERDPRFPLKRHIRRVYDDPLAAKSGTAFRTLSGSPSAGQPQGLVGVASTSRARVFRRKDFAMKRGPVANIETASELIFEVDLRELAVASRSPVAPGAPAVANPAAPRSNPLQR